jgi:hypothetical protein
MRRSSEKGGLSGKGIEMKWLLVFLAFYITSGIFAKEYFKLNV